MRITWLGHACFLLEEDGYRIVTDPYTGVEGYPPLKAEAHAVYCSHHHFDHDAVDCVRLLPARESPFHVRRSRPSTTTRRAPCGAPIPSGCLPPAACRWSIWAIWATHCRRSIWRPSGRWTACWCRWAASIQWMPRGLRRPVMPSAPSGSFPCTITMPLTDCLTSPEWRTSWPCGRRSRSTPCPVPAWIRKRRRRACCCQNSD